MLESATRWWVIVVAIVGMKFSNFCGGPHTPSLTPRSKVHPRLCHEGTPIGFWYKHWSPRKEWSLQEWNSGRCQHKGRGTGHARTPYEVRSVMRMGINSIQQWNNLTSYPFLHRIGIGTMVFCGRGSESSTKQPPQGNKENVNINPVKIGAQAGSTIGRVNLISKKLRY